MEKKKQKLFLLIGIIAAFFVITVVLIYFFVIRKPSTSVNTAAPKANDPAVESRVTILQSNVSLFDFATEEVHEVRDLVHLRVWPALGFYTNQEMKSMKIKNIHVETANGYEVAVIYPGHVPNNLTQYDVLYGTKEEIKVADIKDAGNTLEYNIVDSAQYCDEVYKTNGSPYWFIVLKNLGEYNYTEIFNRDKLFDSGEILRYAGITGEDLNMSFSFDLEIVFQDGEKYVKRFSSVIEGDKYMTDEFYSPELSY